MNETVERLARAIAYASPNGNLSWDRYSSEARNGWRTVARAASEAVRELTKAMVGAREVPGVLEGSDTRLVWIAMINEALK
jgi:hypothetical protein